MLEAVEDAETRLKDEEERLAKATCELAALKKQRAFQVLSSDEAERKSADLWEWEERLLTQAEQQTAREARIAQVEARIDGFREEFGAMNRRIDQRQRMLDERERKLEDRRKELDEREKRLCADVVATEKGMFRWDVPPCGLAAFLIYLSDVLSMLQFAAHSTLHLGVRQRGERLQPGEFALALEAGASLQAARASIIEFGDTIVRDFYVRHPRLAKEEMAAFDAKRPVVAKTGEAGGVASLATLPPPSRLGEGFAIPIRGLLGSGRSFVKERSLIGTIVNTDQGVVLPLSSPMTIAVTGSTGSGKTDLLLALAESHAQPLDKLNTLEHGKLVVWFHGGQSSRDYPAELARAGSPNGSKKAAEQLQALGAAPQGLPSRRVIFVPPGLPVDVMKRRRVEYQGAEIRPIRFGKKDRFAGQLRVLLALEEVKTSAVRVLDQLAAQHEDGTVDDLTRALEKLREDRMIGGQSYATAKKILIDLRKWYRSAERDAESLWDNVDGAYVIVDMRCDHLTQPQTVGAAMAVLGSLSLRKGEGGEFEHAVAVLDEFGKYSAQGKLSVTARTIIKEVRHRGLTLIICCQLPSDLPPDLRELCNGVFAGRTEGQASFDLLCAMKSGYTALGREVVATLPCGVFAACFSEASDRALAGKALLLKIRRAAAQPGGQTTSTVVEDAED